MNELYRVHDTHGRPKIADNIYCFQLSSTETVVWRASDVAHLNWRPFNRPNTHWVSFLTWQARTSVAWHIPLVDWGLGPPQYYSEADECWRVSSPPGPKMPNGLCFQQYPKCFVNMASYHKHPLLLRLFRVTDGDSSAFRQQEKALCQRRGVMSCHAILNTELACVTDHRVSYFLLPSVLGMWFWGMQAFLADEFTAQKIVRN